VTLPWPLFLFDLILLARRGLIWPADMMRQAVDTGDDDVLFDFCGG
jgi:hypothetical protein